MLTTLDVAVVVLWLVASVGLGLWFSRRGSASTDAFLLSDRSLPWWVVGTSMVATTFAADTPLVVSAWVASRGIAENWVWWNLVFSGSLSVFLFARWWRRAGVTTDAELDELRYPGVGGRALRGAKALFFGVFFNVLVIAWVMRAMAKITTVVLDLPPDAAWAGLPVDVWVVLGLFAVTVIYTTGAGFLGVVATDLPQFAVAMGGSILTGVLAWRHAGGLSGIQDGFARHGFDWERTTALLPPVESTPDGPFARWLCLVLVLWWSAKNVDGGGYLAQRLFAAKDETHALLAYLWFTLAHLCLRPWPWIAVGLAGMATFGKIEDPERYYPMMMAEVLPPGLYGLMLAAFLAAFMSTIDTQLHWGSSLVTNDLYRRFLRPHAEDREVLRASQGAVLGLAALGALVSFGIDDIAGAWTLSLSVTSGIGTVYVARWLWWRVSAWAEITAMAFGCAATFALREAVRHHPAALAEGAEAWAFLAEIPAAWLSFPFSAAAIALLGIPVWVTVCLVAPPTDHEHLRRFYLRVRPGGPGWWAIAGDLPGFEQDGPGFPAFFGAAATAAAILGSLLGTGWLILGHVPAALAAYGVTIAGLAGSLWAVRHLLRATPADAT